MAVDKMDLYSFFDYFRAFPCAVIARTSFVTDEEPRSRNVLLEPDLQLSECSSTLHKY